jgi:hypothetical protein
MKPPSPWIGSRTTAGQFCSPDLRVDPSIERGLEGLVGHCIGPVATGRVGHRRPVDLAGEGPKPCL